MAEMFRFQHFERNPQPFFRHSIPCQTQVDAGFSLVNMKQPCALRRKGEITEVWSEETSSRTDLAHLLACNQSLLGIREVTCGKLPIDQVIQEGVNIGWALILIVEIVSMLPHIHRH